MVRTQVFNLSCVFTESGESRFSTTYCGYPKTKYIIIGVVSMIASIIAARTIYDFVADDDDYACDTE